VRTFGRPVPGLAMQFGPVSRLPVIVLCKIRLPTCAFFPYDEPRNQTMAVPLQKISPSRSGWIAAALMALAVVWLHFFFLVNAGGLWRDEVNLLNLAVSPSLSNMARDSFPVLMPLLVKCWSAVGMGRNDVNLRLLGTLIGLGTVAGLWLATWTARRSPPLIALTLFGLNSTIIVFGDSIRAYGLGCLLITCTVAAAGMFLKKTSPGRAGLVAVLAVLSVQALYQNAVLVGAICLGAVAVCVRRKDWRAVLSMLVAGLLAAISLLPYVPVLFFGRETSLVLRTGLAWPRIMADLVSALGFPWRPYVFVWCLLALVIVAGAGAALRRKPATGNPGEGFVADDVLLFAGMTLFVAVTGFLGFLWLAGLPGQPWYFLPLMALAAACFDLGFPPLPRYAQAAALGLVLATAVISFPVARRDLDYRLTNIDVWARGLMAEASAEDFVVVTPWFCGISFGHYFKGSTPWTTLPPLPDYSTHRYDLVQKQMQTGHAMQPVLDQMTSTLRSGHRVWILAITGLVKIPDPGEPPPPDLPPPPLPDTGWGNDPYEYNWTSQVTHFLSSHSRQFGRVKNPWAGRRTAEDMDLFLAEGWTDSGPSAPAKNPDAK
jgi:hypothetical protein